MKNNRPALRINGYLSNWDEFRMIDLVTPIVREVPKPTTSYKRLSVRSHAKGTFHQVVENPNTIAMDKLYVVHQDDLIVNITFAWEHAIAIAEEKDHDLLVSHRFPTFLINKSDVNFIKYLVTLKSFKNRLDLISPGGAGRNRVLNKKDFNNMKLFAPAQIDEQKKIGSFFKNLDDTIALHQQELEALKLTKKGFLQKMFPRAGESIPEVRFPGFKKEWTNYKIADISKVTMGQSPSGKNYTSNPNDHILVQGNADLKKGYVHPRVWTTQVTKTANPGDIILCVRAPVGDVAKTSHEVVLGRGVASLEGDEFLYHLLYKMKSEGYWTRFSSGSTFESINSTDIKDAVVMIPCKDEQIKIGEFFRQLDEVIELKEKELEALKETKKGFLQKMFV